LSPTTIGGIFFLCALGGLLAGLQLGRIMPAAQLQGDAKESIRTGIGLIATMTALVLGLVTASAKQSFDDVDKTVRSVAADLLVLDGVLARYGSEAAPIREHLKVVVASRIHTFWPERVAQGAPAPQNAAGATERLAVEVRSLVPKGEEQAWLKSRATDLTESLLEVRFRVIGRVGSSVPRSFLVILAFWLTVTFASYGLFAPRTAPVLVVLVLCAISVAAAVFLVLELDGPLEGLVRVSGDPLVAVLAHVNR
jgi:hypothetical protein